MIVRRWIWVFALLLLPRIAHAQTFRFMPIGDSITNGQSAEPGFRDDLHALLNAEPGLTFNFVGSTGSPPYQGHFLGGREIEDFYPSSFGYGWGNGTFDTTPDMAAPNTPQVVAIHLGTNDLNSQLPPYVPYSFDHGQTFTRSHMGELADYLRFLLQWQDGTLGNDLSHIVLSMIIPMQGRSQDIKQFADGIVAMTEDFGEGIVMGDPVPIALADHYHRFLTNPNLFTFGPGDWMTDALHPNDAGYDQMADVYHGAIVAAVTDTTAPSPIIDLQVVSADTTRVVLTWTAVGDDNLLGRALRYDLRVSTQSFDELTFGFAPQAVDEPDPKPAWEADTLEVRNLLPGTRYYFAVKAVDDAGNRSTASPVVTATTAGVQQFVLTLRDGLNSYAGTDDNPIDDLRPRENWGAGVRINVGKGGGSGDLYRGLVRFDVSSIPPGSAILDARMRLYCYDLSSFTTVEIGAYRLTKRWVEGTRQNWSQQTGASCWNFAQLDVLAWSTPGAAAASDAAQNNDPNFDRFATPEDVTVLTANNAWYEWDLTNAVAQWVSGAWNNEGVILKAAVESTVNRRGFYSSESTTNQSLRPTLVVTFAPPVVNAPPVADAGGPYVGEEDVPVLFDGAGSFDPEGQPITYAWDFGDGGTATTAAPTHTYDAPGAYTVSLIVHDGVNPSAPDTVTATIAVSTGIGGVAAAPLTTRLLGAMPNPVALSAAVRYDLAARAHVRLRIVDVQGRIVRTLVDGVVEPGEHRAEWNGADQAGRRLPAGIYFGELEAAGVRATRKLLLLP